jgi:precorrin-2 dehydrogenase/sirohydrochlorin ferrochelatase
MGYYPITVQLDGRPCLVIGGGEVAERKVEALLAAGARVTVVAPALTAELAALAETHEIVHHPRSYRPGDVRGAQLAIAATDDPEVQRAVAAEAEAAGVLLNVVDVPALCTFIAPAVVQRGEVSIAVSTGGASPALAHRVRTEIEARFGPEYGLFAQILRRLRERLPPSPERQALLVRLVESPVLDCLRSGRLAEVDTHLGGIVGADCSLATLGVAPVRTTTAAGGDDGA